MNPDLKKWNSFKFARRTGKTGDGPDANDTSGPLPFRLWPPEWPDVSRLFSGDPWRTMGEFFHDPFANAGTPERWFGDFSPSRFQPRIDVVDDGEALRITAEMPGMDRTDVQTSIEGGALVLRGQKKQDIRSEENGCFRLERAYGAFMRTIPLPDDVDVDRVDAKFDQGVLTLRLPKTGSSESPFVRHIEIK